MWDLAPRLEFCRSFSKELITMTGVSAQFSIGLELLKYGPTIAIWQHDVEQHKIGAMFTDQAHTRLRIRSEFQAVVVRHIARNQIVHRNIIIDYQHPLSAGDSLPDTNIQLLVRLSFF